MVVTVGQKTTGRSCVRIPAGKSVSHRVLIAASLADGVSRIENLSNCEDVNATIRCLGKAGTTIIRKDEVTEVRGAVPAKCRKDLVLDAGESGSTLRFLIPVLSSDARKTIWTGGGRLMERPLAVYEDIYRRQDCLFEKEGKNLTVKGKLKPGVYTVPGDVSSQFITGLLMILPTLEEDSEIRILPPYESSSYVRMTENVLKLAGIRIKDEGLTIRIPGKQVYKPFETSVPADDSAAVFFGVLAALCACEVHLIGVAKDSDQADHVFLEILERAGCTVTETQKGYAVSGNGCLKPLHEDLSDCPDLGPALFALAAMIQGGSVFTGVKRLRYKESDRIAAMKEELAKFGCVMEDTEDTVTVHGGTVRSPSEDLDGHGDHRIVMALSVLAVCVKKPVRIRGAEAVTKSFPDFFHRLEKTGTEVKRDD